MGENQRETFRIEADPELQAELLHEGRAVPCTLDNLSAGGARVSSRLRITAGTPCALGVHLSGDLRAAAGSKYLQFAMEVVDATEADGSMIDYRLRIATGAEMDQDAMAKLVFAAQRRALARRTGASQASPMVSDEERRRGLRPDRSPRFSKGSLRPDQD